MVSFIKYHLEQRKSQERRAKVVKLMDGVKVAQVEDFSNAYQVLLDIKIKLHISYYYIYYKLHLSYYGNTCCREIRVNPDKFMPFIIIYCYGTN